MLVRKLEEKEITKAAQIYKESFGSVSKVIEYNKQEIYVAEENNEILGLCAIDYINDIFKDKKIAYINSVCTTKKYQQKGVATFLLLEIEKICKKNNVNEIMLTSSKEKKEANNLYKKLNYRIHETNVYKKDV